MTPPFALPPLRRRDLLRGTLSLGGMAAMAPWVPAWARTISPGLSAAAPALSGEDIALRIARQSIRIGQRSYPAIGINGTVPAPLLRLREGQRLRLHVENQLDQDSSLHWHGLLVPAQFDGVPGVSFPGIRPRSSFLYDFPIRQSGTYWYHSHSGFQEQVGLYGPIIIDPEGPDPIESDREHVILLSDHSAQSPELIFHRLKADPSYYNRQQQTFAGLLAGRDQPLGKRLRWGAMRMSPADIADVTAQAYTYLVNGHGPQDGWTALFRPGERLRLRLINASSMTIFDLRIPGLAMTVVQADGQPVRPVETDEIQIGVAETYDVIVTPSGTHAYALVAESVDRSGMALATLAPREGMMAPVPALRPRPLATMRDMGMDMGGMKGMAMGGGMSGMDMSMRNFANAPAVKPGPGVQTIAPMPTDRTGEAGQGLADAGHRVLTYHDLIAREVNPDTRAPGRSIDIHLTGNMERYMWSFDGVKMSDTMEPIALRQGERVRIHLINDTMMAHPIHLHGHFFELVTGKGDHAPRKHTVLVQPGGKASFDLTADAPGDWAFHCHLLYHMASGMMRVVSVRAAGDAA
ncbi:MAG: copper resistance system multicopper oxidase [Sphingomonadales bacterium]|nr:copper resistance system multicopper oxidase [Sphingomonadales bacterium]MDE2171074.1 copper resistance system multicopper oxidase [Sphingomonadales bacterium]